MSGRARTRSPFRIRFAIAAIVGYLALTACRAEYGSWIGVPMCAGEGTPFDIASCCKDVVACESGLPCEFAVQKFSDARRVDKGALPPLFRLLASDDWLGARDAATALGTIGDPSAIPRLALALDSGDFGLRIAALEALSGFGPRAIDVSPEIERQTTHWSVDVRRAASSALHAIAGAAPIEIATEEPIIMHPTGTGWKVSRSGRSILLADIGVRQIPETPAPCANVAASVNARDVLYEDGTCILACAEGEFGGSLLRSVPSSEDGALCRFGRSLTASRFFAAHGSYIALSPAGLSRLSRPAGGRWAVKLLATFPGVVSAYGLDSAGDPVVLTQDPPAWRESGPKGRRAYVLRLTPSEELVSWP